MLKSKMAPQRPMKTVERVGAMDGVTMGRRGLVVGTRVATALGWRPVEAIAAGDMVLEEVAHILREETRNGDFIARVGGDEFVLVIEDGVDADRLGLVAKRILARLAEPFEYDGRSCEISASIGVTLSTSYDTPSPETILADADTALYASKRSGRSCYSFHETQSREQIRALRAERRRMTAETEAGRPPAA